MCIELDRHLAASAAVFRDPDLTVRPRAKEPLGLVARHFGRRLLALKAQVARPMLLVFSLNLCGVADHPSPSPRPCLARARAPSSSTRRPEPAAPSGVSPGGPWRRKWRIYTGRSGLDNCSMYV